MAKVQVAVSERWAVVQNEALTSGILGLDFAVKIEFFPVLNTSGLAFHEITSHWKSGFWEIERIFEVLSHDIETEGHVKTVQSVFLTSQVKLTEFSRRHLSFTLVRLCSIRQLPCLSFKIQ